MTAPTKTMTDSLVRRLNAACLRIRGRTDGCCEEEGCAGIGWCAACWEEA